MNALSVEYAFEAAEASSFKLFFSFDYAGEGAWPKDSVINYLSTYTGSPAYYKYNGKPLVSTFEGPENAADWVDIKNAVDCFFIPDWSSLGAKVALDKGQVDGTQVVDGLFNWGAWPEGANDMDTDVDASYNLFLDGKPYMMPVSPWFYTNMPGFKKNWLWRGDDLWYTRWQQVLAVQPEFVEIISWNDYGESHYIGELPPYQSGYNAFNVGKSPFNYAENMPHDGWLHSMGFFADYYKHGTASFSAELLSTWYRLTPAASCLPAGTTANNVEQLQMEMAPAAVIQDKVFYSALLGSSCDVTVSIGGTTIQGSWQNVPAGGVGVYHGSVSTNGLTGDVVVTISRGGSTITQVQGEAITTDCSNNDGFANYNAWTGSSTGPGISTVTTPIDLKNLTCTKGTGKGGLQELCEFTCKYGYCPIGACTCLALGTAESPPAIVNVDGYPGLGKDCNYIGLCSYACNHGFCPDDSCSTDPAQDGACESVVDPHAGLVCNSGSGSGNMAGLCSWNCNYGFCPDPCTCNGWGTQNTPPEGNEVEGYAVPSSDTYDSVRSMCDYACRHGYCPEGVCTQTPVAGEFLEMPNIDCSENPTHWTCLMCTKDKTCFDPDQTGQEEWDCSKAQDLLDYFLETYNHTDATGSGWLANLATVCGYYSSVKFSCAVGVTGGGCDDPMQCTDSDTLAGNVVLNSVIEMNAFYSNWYRALGDAETALLGESTNVSLYYDAFSQVLSVTKPNKQFNKVFNPSPGDSLWAEIGSALLDIVFESSSSTMFKLAASAAKKLGGSLSDDVWESAYGMATGQIEDAVEGAEDDEPNITYGDLTELITNVTTTTQKGLADYFATLTNGEPDNKEQLAKVISNGVWLRFDNTTKYDMTQAMKAMILSKVIPTVWRSNIESRPAIIMSDTADDTSNPFSSCPGSISDFPCLSDDEAEAARFSTGGKTFWVVGVMTGCKEYSEILGGIHCVSSRFATLPGLDQLDGNHTAWGSLSLEDIVISDYAGYQLNGNANGYNISTAQNAANIIDASGTTSPYAYEAGPQTPGLWDLPICDFETASTNWDGWQTHSGAPDTCQHWPCCTCDELQIVCG